MTITAAADGSALGNPGPAGWAWYIDDANWAAGGWKHATNNQGELMAVLDLFRSTAHLPDDLHILCDSQYVINCVTKWMPGWKKKGWRKGDGKPVMNVDLLREIDEAIVGRSYRFEWVRGHVGHVLNEAADSRARAVAEAFQRGTPVPTGPGLTLVGSTAPAEPAAVPTTEPAAAATRPVRPPAEPAARTVDDSSRSSRPEPPSLFSFDDLPHDAGTDRHVTLTLSDTDYARLVERARRAGRTPEQLLRDLI
ncbi:ribonuclease HI [Labedella populi]|uniref:ribonuclease H n=1 Tax=Labedella populi TaxID=2498850 RepID=A0A444QC21_9MICO|nr:RNase H family protein [Labedella populi]RWZ61587.1 ribonuclease HI [Labedella populi]